ncbi:MAG: hypothetical protein LBJ69_00680 [Holosporales bacterium]|jgi:hypothetical protein|nr:hypothetical protein [Holosporales bacterium]
MKLLKLLAIGMLLGTVTQAMEEGRSPPAGLFADSGYMRAIKAAMQNYGMYSFQSTTLMDNTIERMAKEYGRAPEEIIAAVFKQLLPEQQEIFETMRGSPGLITHSAFRGTCICNGTEQEQPSSVDR